MRRLGDAEDELSRRVPWGSRALRSPARPRPASRYALLARALLGPCAAGFLETALQSSVIFP